MRASIFQALPLLLLLVLAGCGPSRPVTYPVSGQVLLDGQPIEGASVMFQPVGGGRPATGTTDAQGNFKLKTFDPEDGALAGKHGVSIRLVKVTGAIATSDGLSGGVGPGGIKEEWVVPKKYADHKTSGQEVEVTSGMPPVVLRLTK